MRRRIIWAGLSVGLALLTAPIAGSSLGKVAAGERAASPSGGGVSGSFGDPGDAYLKFTITGAALKLRAGTPSSYEGSAAPGSTITLSGQMTVARAAGTVSYVNMSAQVGDRSWAWPPEGQDNRVEGRTVSRSFNLSFKIPPGSTAGVSGSASLRVCGGVCGGYGLDFRVVVKQRASIPAIRAVPVTKVQRPATYVRLPLSVTDASGKAKVHGLLYEAGTPIKGLSTGFVTADGRLYDWKVRLVADLKGPLYYCLWAQNPAGKKSAKAPRSSCAWLSLLVDIDRVSNTCGGEGWDVIVAIENAFGNTSSYRDPDQDETYVVHFEDACNLHDAGYGGYTVRDRINGGLVDYRTWSREDVDLKFQRDMQALCRAQIPAAAKEARAKCLGDITRFAIVRSVGSRFFDADLTKPGLQRKGARNNS